MKDKSGKPVEGLTAKDFTVTEDGAEQTIRFFEFQKVPEAAEPEPRHYRRSSRAAQEASRNADYGGAARRYALSESPPAGALLRHDRHAAAGSVARRSTAAQKFIRTQMTPADLRGDHAIRWRRGSGAVGFHRRSRPPEQHPRNHDRGRRRRVSMRPPATTARRTPARPSARTTASSTSSTPTASCPRCRPRPRCWASSTRRKSLLYFASGLQLNGSTTRRNCTPPLMPPIRAGVSFWPIDARGLVAQAPLGDATQGIAGRNRHVHRRFRAGDDAPISSNRRTRLYALAADTGGKALLDNNDLAVGIVQAQKAFRATTSSATTRRTQLWTANSAASRSR